MEINLSKFLRVEITDLQYTLLDDLILKLIQ